MKYLLKKTFLHPSYLLFENYFSDNERKALQNHLQNIPMSPSALHNDTSHYTDTSNVAEVEQKGIFFKNFKNLFLAVNSKHWKFDRPFSFQFKCVEYGKGDQITWHADGSYNMKCTYLITMVAMLSDEKDFDGGEIELVGWTGEKKIFNLKKNSVLIFPSFLKHRVKKVTRGVRKTAVLIAITEKKLTK